MAKTATFSRFLMLTLTVFQALSLSLAFGLFHAALTNSLDQEFAQSLRAQTAEAGLALLDRLSALHARAHDLTQDDNVRKGLAQGERTPVEAAVARTRPPFGGARFHVVRHPAREIIPELPANLAPFAPLLLELDLPDQPEDVNFIGLDEAVGFLCIRALPIRDKDTRLGTALALYDLVQDQEFWRRLAANSSGRLLLERHGRIHDLRLGKSPMPSPLALENLEAEGNGLWLRMGKDVAVARIKDFPGLWFALSTRPLMEERNAVWPKLAWLGLSIFAVTFILSVLIARRVSGSLSNMARQAQEMAHLPAGRRLDLEALEHREFLRLGQAFNQVLDNLEEATDKLQERGRLEQEAHQLRYRALVEASPTGILSLDRQGQVLFANRTFGEMTGYRPEEILDWSALRFFPPDQHERALEVWRTRYKPAVPLRMEYPFLRKDGAAFWVDTWLVPDPDPRTGATLVYVQDVTKRRQARRDLAREHSRLAAVLDGNPIATFVIDAEHRLVHWNRACETLTGESKNNLLGRPVPSAIFYQGAQRPVLADLVLEMDEHTLLKLYRDKNLAPSQLIPEAFEASDLLTIGGQAKHFYFLAARLRDEQGRVLGAVETMQDVTEREQLARQLQQAQKMEAVGTLSGGMAHEFNNILAAIQGYARLLIMGLEQGQPVERFAKEIDHSCRRAAGLTRKMLTFSRREAGESVPVEVNGLVREVQGLLRQTLPPDIELVLRLTDGLPPVLAEPTQLEQVLLNLGLNARDALPHGGRITFVTQLERLDADPGRRPPWTTPDCPSYVKISVADNGQGMAPQVLQRAFEPFFTTKETGKGTGLGLSIAYSIIKSFAGHIEAQSKSGQGARFDIILPALARDTPLPAPTGGDEALPRGTGQRVLVVDDEPQLREIAREILTGHGYEVETAGQGREAVAAYARARAQKSPFDLVILDLAMPVMDGQTCMNHLLEMDPKARVIIATGYGGEAHDLAKLKESAWSFLPKPFDLRQLLREVAGALKD